LVLQYPGFWCCRLWEGIDSSSMHILSSKLTVLFWLGLLNATGIQLRRKGGVDVYLCAMRSLNELSAKYVKRLTTQRYSPGGVATELGV